MHTSWRYLETGFVEFMVLDGGGCFTVPAVHNGSLRVSGRWSAEIHGRCSFGVRIIGNTETRYASLQRWMPSVIRWLV